MTQYYSNSKEEYVNINDMHHQHVWYAFKKLCDRLEELGICEHIWEDDYKPTNFKKLVGGYVRRDVYELLFDKCERLEKENRKLKKDVSTLASVRSPKSQTNQILKLEKEVSRLRSIIVRLYDEQNTIGHRYAFSNIPNTDEGRQIVHKLKKWLNKDSYNMRVRGQYLDKTKLSDGESWKTYSDGQPLSKSRCIRVYLDKKKESA